MMRAFWLLLLLVATAPASAQTATIRTGEHADFSRMVIYLDAPTPWRFGRTEDGYGLRLGRSGTRFDLSRVFDLIPRTRLVDVSQEASGDLRMQVNCECNADVFEFRPNVLVIDIRDGAPTDGSPFERPLDAPLAPAPVSRPPPVAALDPAETDRLMLYWRDQTLQGRAPGSGLPMAQAAEPGGSDTSAARPAATDSAGSGLLPGVAMPDPRVAEARGRLLEELGRAATQGLLDIEQPLPALRGREAEPERRASDEADETNGQHEAAAASPDASDHMSVLAETGIDRDALGSRNPTAVTQDGMECLSDEQLDVANWGNGEPAALQISGARAALIGEFDTPSPEAVGNLARLYLFLTFGAEAREALQSFAVTVPDADVLKNMGEIMDAAPVTIPGRLSEMTDCPTAAAMWATLAQPSLTRGQPVDRGAVLRSFSALPLALRRHLGPQLSEKFLSVGDSRTATLIRNAITRAAGPHGDEVTVLDARLNLADGNTSNAENALRQVVADQNSASPEALVVFVENRVARGEPLDAETAATAAAMAYEYRGTEEGARLARAQILSQAATGDFSSAFSALAELPQAGPTDLSPRVTQELCRILAQTPKDAHFLQYSFEHADLMAGKALPRDLRLSIAQRFLTLGFPQQARAMISEQKEPDTAERLALSLASILERDGTGALRALSGLTGQEASDLRGRALVLLGDNAGAALAFAEAQDQDSQASAAWRAGELDVVQASGSPAQQEAVAALAELSPEPEGSPNAPETGAPAGPATGTVIPASATGAEPAATTPPAEPPPGPLARNRALLEQSRTTRETLDALLDAFPVER